ncbi:DNA segregation ATPase FtsK/SpoIIIE, S-DNA-T family [Paenibacillus uliginis N3/975]|uniref:DNA segregation ATPase FtsK/SpoIIIE, S-DNA-T family n=1 Tax=Paenibacillus uliginis N3/975 TaxID=1313296 RepID=A0A1X7H9I1_9BACL|nr:DNA translocase FtsK [Paenibacillus uliginis]SMF81933.1 DNA segregation ATPase FtsK/SpoIIIE, S-DNA-T family [Paenibacillus uliginis N3/975]
MASGVTLLAKRKRKKRAVFASVLKYEIYGIILMTLSVIALSGEAPVGRSLSKMSGYLLGKYYFVIPLIGIYYGLMVMIHRKWPKRWNSRRTGVLLLVLSLTLMSSISGLEPKLAPIGQLNSGNVLTQIHSDLQGELLHGKTDGNHPVMGRDISGGYAGALQFSLLLMFFGGIGARLIMIVMLFISFMLITNLSYVDLMRMLRTRLVNASGHLQKKMQGRQTKAKASASKAERKKPQSLPVYEDEDDDSDDLDDVDMSLSRRKSPVFFQLFGNKGSKSKNKAEQAAQDSVVTSGKGGPAAMGVAGFPGMDPVEDHSFDYDMPGDASIQSPAPTSPIIRDFFEQVKHEDVVEEEEPDEMDSAHLQETATDGAPEGAGEMEPGMAEHASKPVSGHTSEGEEGPESTPLTPPPPPPKPYKLPPFRLLSKPNNGGKLGDQNDYMQTARKLEATLESFGVRAKVLEVVRGPSVTRYEIQPDIGVKVSRIVSLTDDIALALAAKDIRMEAPIPGKSAIGIEVPNNEVSIVTMREVMETPMFHDAQSKLSIAFGRDISGQTIVGNLARMPHLLVAGATGSGKSVCINGIITSILYKAKPDEVKFLMVDPKMVELNVYNGIPHLMAPVVTDPKRASLALKKIVVEMEKRYELFSKSGTRNIEGYNTLMKDNPSAVLPYIVVIVDELADLMMVAAHDVEEAITRLAQMARAAGIHLIIATQRPSVDVITGVIKANIPSRIAFGVSSQVDSRTILDMAGAEKLLGRGDMLFMPMGSSKPVRVQGAFMSDQEVENIVGFVRDQGQAEYDESLVPEIDESSTSDDEVLDELYDQAIGIILEAKQASVSLLQRRMRVGYTRAARLIDSMEARGVIGPYEGSKPREVLMSMEQYQQSRVSS